MSTNINEQLYDACKKGNLADVKRLVAAGAGVNAIVKSFTALCVASRHGHVEIVRFLLDSGANVDQFDGNGYAPIYLAAREGHDSVVDLLAFKGANVDLRKAGRTPLIAAVCNGHAACVETLVVFGADVDSVAVYSETGVMKAVQYHFTKVVQLLLSLNADTTIVNPFGRTALQLTKTDEIEQLLLDHDKLTVEDRKQLREETMTRLQHKVGIRLMRFAQDTIVGICLAMSSLELPPYVLLWIIDFLPNYDKLSHHKKIELITSVRASIWKIQEQREQQSNKEKRLKQS